MRQLTTLILGLFLTTQLLADIIDIRFFNPQIISNQYCVTVQAISQDQILSIGSSTIFFTYNQLAINNPTVNPINFSATPCIDNGMSNLYGTNFSFLEVPNMQGEVNYSINLNTPNTGCPNITTTEWIDIAEFCFDIVDATQIADLTFNTQFTAFNTGTDDGINQNTLGTLTDGTTENNTMLNACNDGLQNGLEISIDCGGFHCYDCVTANYTSSDSNICSGTTIDFINNSVNSNAWSWDFGGLGMSNLENPSFTFNTTGSYVVTLISSNDGHSDTFQQTITVNPSTRKRVCKITWTINQAEE